MVTLERSSLTHQAEIELCRVTYACDLMLMCVEFWDEILLREEECETPENLNPLRKGKMVISIKIRSFCISQMMKRISSLKSSRKI